jgi:hypothetical protein
MVDKKQIKNLLTKHFRVDGKVTINPKNGLVSVVGDVNLKEEIKTSQLPVSFEEVAGYFDCSHNQLDSLEGAPRDVGRVFSCNNNRLTDLKGAPTDVGTSFSCEDNPLASLEGAPMKVGNNFWCDYNKNLPLLRLLTYQRIMLFDVPSQLTLILQKHAGTGRRGAIQAAREIMQAGELLQKEQALDHNPFEANARW